MFDQQIYHCLCHGCGALHEVVSAFMSTPVSMAVTLDGGRRLTLPAHGCPACMAITENNPVGLAWKHGSTPETQARAAREVRERMAREGEFWRNTTVRK